MIFAIKSSFKKVKYMITKFLCWMCEWNYNFGVKYRIEKFIHLIQKVSCWVILVQVTLFAFIFKIFKWPRKMLLYSLACCKKAFVVVTQWKNKTVFTRCTYLLRLQYFTYQHKNVFWKYEINKWDKVHNLTHKRW